MFTPIPHIGYATVPVTQLMAFKIALMTYESVHDRFLVSVYTIAFVASDSPLR